MQSQSLTTVSIDVPADDIIQAINKRVGEYTVALEESKKRTPTEEDPFAMMIPLNGARMAPEWVEDQVWKLNGLAGAVATFKARGKSMLPLNVNDMAVIGL